MTIGRFSANVPFSYLKPLLFPFHLPFEFCSPKNNKPNLWGWGAATKIAKDSGDSFTEQNCQREGLESCCVLGLTKAGDEPQPSNAVTFITQLEYKGVFLLKDYFSNPLMKKLGNIAINSSLPL